MSKLLSNAGVRTAINKLTAAAIVAIASSTNASPTVVTATAHGLSTGDWIALFSHATNTAANGVRTIVKVDANSFSMLDAITAVAVNGNGVGGATGSIQRLTSALTPVDLKDLSTSLSRKSYKRDSDASRGGESTIKTIFGQ